MAMRFTEATRLRILASKADQEPKNQILQDRTNRSTSNASDGKNFTVVKRDALDQPPQGSEWIHEVKLMPPSRRGMPCVCGGRNETFIFGGSGASRNFRTLRLLFTSVRHPLSIALR